MDTRDLMLSHRKHAKRVFSAQGGFISKWELSHVGKFLEVIRVHADFIEFPAVMRHVVVRMTQLSLRVLGLQRDVLIALCVLVAHLVAVVVVKNIKNGGQGIAFLIGKVWGSTPLNQVSHWLCRDLISSELVTTARSSA